MYFLSEGECTSSGRKRLCLSLLVERIRRMSHEKKLLLGEFHLLLDKLEISEQISFLEKNNEKIKSRIHDSEKNSKSSKLKRKHDIGKYDP